jgi:asparagine synthase (glutamine-hydrolysing)
VTPYEHIRSVPAATCLTFSSGADPSSSIPTQTRQTFWRLASGIVRYRDRRDYEAELRCLWADAVRVRLRSPGTVWAELSGGLDSSSVVCMADALIKAGRTEAEAIQPLSHVTLQSPEGDERRFIADVEAQIGRRSEIVGVELHDELTDPDLEWVTPFASWGVSLAGVQRIRARGGRLVLSGRVGDAVMGAQFDNSAAVYDDFGAGHPVIGLRNLRLWSRACRKPLIEIARNLLVGWLPWGRGDRIDPPQSGYDLLSPALRGRLDEDPSIANVLDDVRRSKRDMAALLLAYASGSRLTIPLHPPGVTFTYPFTHRPLVDFMMAIPGELLSSPGETRALMRRAFEGLVPPRILRRRSKGFYPPSALRAARGRAAAMRPVERLEVVRRGWIDPRRLDEAIRHLTDGGSQRGAGVRLVLRLEQWLAALRRGPAAIPDGKEVTTDAVHHA